MFSMSCCFRPEAVADYRATPPQGAFPPFRDAPIFPRLSYQIAFNLSETVRTEFVEVPAPCRASTGSARTKLPCEKKAKRMSNLVCDFYDDDGVLDGPWHWSAVLCHGCFESHLDWPVRVSPKSASWEKCERCGKPPCESLDSSLDADDEEVPSPAQPEKLLSPTQSIAPLIGHERISHAEAVRRVYAYIKANGLHDPESQRIILCDSTLEAALGVPKVNLFTLSKLVQSKLQ